MLDKKQMQEIQDLKLRGYTKSEILDYYEQQGVFCKPFLQKVAELFCRKLRLHFTENCRPPLQTNTYSSFLPAGLYLGWIKLSMTSGFAVAPQSLTS